MVCTVGASGVLLFRPRRLFAVERKKVGMSLSLRISPIGSVSESFYEHPCACVVPVVELTLLNFFFLEIFHDKL